MTRNTNRATATIGTAATTAIIIPVLGSSAITICVQNTGDAALNSFALQGRVGADTPWFTIADESTDFTPSPLPSGTLLRFSEAVNPITLAADNAISFGLNCTAISELRIVATVASGTTTLETAFCRGA